MRQKEIIAVGVRGSETITEASTKTMTYRIATVIMMMTVKEVVTLLVT